MSHTSRILIALCLVLGACATTSAPPPAPSTTPATPAKAEPALLPLHLATTPFPPFADSEDQPRVALDLVSSALERSGYLAQIQIVADGTLTNALRVGDYDGSPAIWKSSEREEFLLYSAPYLENRLMLVGKKGSAVDAASFAALPGKKIGLVEGYAYGSEVEKAKEPVFVKAKSMEESFRSLLRGEVDYVLADALVIHHLIRQYPVQAQEHLSVGEKPLVTRTLHLAIRKTRPDAERIIEGFNRQLVSMLADGSYHRALQVDWIHADIDGDGRLEMVAAGEQVGTTQPSSGYQLVSMAPTGAGVTRGQADPATAHIVIKGVSYDSWDNVPDDYKRTPPQSGIENKPRTLRVSVFEF